MLLQNGTYFAAIPITQTGGTLAGESVFLGLRDQTFVGMFAGQGQVLNKSAVPSGYNPDDAWFPALKAGGLAAGAETSLTGSASIAGGINLTGSANLEITGSAALVGLAAIEGSATGELTGTADAVALVSMAATGSISLAGTATAGAAVNATASGTIELTGSADISQSVSVTASGTMSLSGSATAQSGVFLTASGSASLDATADAVGVFGMVASGSSELAGTATYGTNSFVTATGSLTLAGTAIITAQAFMTGTAGGPDALSPQGLASAVWGAVDSANNQAGTMGAKVNAAASAGDPWTAVVPGSYPAGSAGYLLSQLAVENPEIATQLEDVWKRLGLDAANPLVSNALTISAGDVVMDVTASSTETVLSRR